MSRSANIDDIVARAGFDKPPPSRRSRRTSDNNAGGQSNTGGQRATVVARRRRGYRDATSSRLWRHTLPHRILAGLLGAGALTHAAGAAGGRAIVVAGYLAVAVGLAVVWAAKPRRRPAGQRLVRIAAAAGWLLWIAAGGMTWTAVAALVAGGHAAALRYWRRIRLPDPPPWPAGPPVTDALSPPAMWAQHNASSSGSLTNSFLTGESALTAKDGQPIGQRYDLHLVPGRQDLDAALKALALLRTGLRLRPKEDLIIERHPRLDEAVLQATIVRRSPVLERAVSWPGHTFDPATGRIRLGPYIDGEGLAVWSAIRTNRLFGGFLAGCTNSGKSRLLDSLALGYAEAGCVVWAGDPQSGASSAFLARNADYFGMGNAGILAMLQLARKVKQLRQLQNAVNEWEGWAPEQTQADGTLLRRPGLVIFVDECHAACADPRISRLLEELAREGGKLGIAVVLADQVATLEAFGGDVAGGGDADALRSSVIAGNQVLLRSTSNSTDHVLVGVKIDSTMFPAMLLEVEAGELDVGEALEFVDAAGDDQFVTLTAYKLGKQRNWSNPRQLVDEVRREQARRAEAEALTKKAAAEGLTLIEDPRKAFGYEYWSHRLEGKKAIARARKDGTLVAHIRPHGGGLDYYSTSRPKKTENRSDADELRLVDERERRRAMTARAEHAATLAARPPKLPQAAAADVVDAWLWAPGNDLAALAGKWLTAAGVGPDPDLPAHQWWQQVRVADWPTRVHAAHALAIARHEVRARTTYRSWTREDAAWLARLAEHTGYTPTQWEHARLAAIDAPPAGREYRLLYDPTDSVWLLLDPDGDVVADHDGLEEDDAEAAKRWAAEVLADTLGAEALEWTTRDDLDGETEYLVTAPGEALNRATE